MTLCQQCANAWRDPNECVQACALYAGKPLMMYGRCAEAAVNGKCEQFQPNL